MACVSFASLYSVEFKQRYFKAQAERMNRLIASALEKMQRIQRDASPYPDDDVFLVVRGEGALDDGRCLRLEVSGQCMRLQLDDGHLHAGLRHVLGRMHADQAGA